MRAGPLDSPHGQDREAARRGRAHRRGSDRGASAAPCGVADAGRRRRGREATRQGQADRPGTARHPDGSGLVRGDRSVRGASGARLRDGGQAAAGRRHRDRLRHDRRPQGVRRVAGLHGLRRLDGRGARPEGLQGDGPRAADRRAVHPDQRLGRRADPGGRGEPRRLRLHLRAQRARQRRDPADQRDHGAVRRRRRLLPRDHRLHLHGEGDLAHVHHRPRRDQDRHRRGRHDGGAGRRDDPRDPVGRGLVRRRGRRGRAACACATCCRSCRRTTSRTRRRTPRPTIPSA